MCILSYTHINVLKGILVSSCNDHYPQFTWPGLPDHEIERVVAIFQKCGELNRDILFSVVAHTKMLSIPKREKIWTVLENFDYSRDDSEFESFIREKICVEIFGWLPCNCH